MRTQDSVAKIQEAAPQLNEALMRARLAEYSKFGLPSGGGDGRGGERPLPMLGNTDRAILVARREYEQTLAHAALALDSALRLQNAWCIPQTDDTEKEKKLEDTKPAGSPCANVACDRWMTGAPDNRPRRLDGIALCERCYRFTRRTGKNWTPAREALEASA